jgi:hypothetical protein
MKKLLSRIKQTLTGPSAKPLAPSEDKRDELCLLINSRHPIITVETSEETRLEQTLFEVSSELDVPLFTWSVTTGLARAKGAPLYNTQTPEQALTNIDLIHGDAIFLLKDFARRHPGATPRTSVRKHACLIRLTICSTPRSNRKAQLSYGGTYVCDFS